MTQQQHLPLRTLSSIVWTEARATLALNRLTDAELGSLLQVFEELGQRAADSRERLAARLLEPVVNAFQRERDERLAGRTAAPWSVRLRLPESMRQPLITFFDGFLSALQQIGATRIRVVLLPVVIGLRGESPALS